VNSNAWLSSTLSANSGEQRALLDVFWFFVKHGQILWIFAMESNHSIDRASMSVTILKQEFHVLFVRLHPVHGASGGYVCLT
jgi:hypothetical protein